MIDLDAEILATRSQCQSHLLHRLNYELDQCHDVTHFIVGLGIWFYLTTPTSEEIGRPDWRRITQLAVHGIPVLGDDSRDDLYIGTILCSDHAHHRHSKRFSGQGGAR
jgi:hypothetical protein